MAPIRQRAADALSTSSIRRDLLLLALSIALITAPWWAAGWIWIGDAYVYESTEVVATETGVEFVDPDVVPDGVPISDRIACSGTLVDRSCALERGTLEAGPFPTGVYSEDLHADERLADHPYQFVQVDGTVHLVTWELNESAEPVDGAYPVEANLSTAIPDAALHAVALDPDDADISSTILEAAEQGQATSGTAADVPASPIVLDDGTYHRVYLVEEGLAGAESPLAFAVFVGVGFGAVTLLSLSRKLRVSVRYVDD